MTKARTTPNTAAAKARLANPLPIVTLHEFFRQQGRGAQKRMATALGVSKGSLSNIAAADRPTDPGPRVFVSYSLAKRMSGYLEQHGCRLEIERLLRTEDAPQ